MQRMEKWSLRFCKLLVNLENSYLHFWRVLCCITHKNKYINTLSLLNAIFLAWLYRKLYWKSFSHTFYKLKSFSISLFFNTTSIYTQRRSISLSSICVRGEYCGFTVKRTDLGTYRQVNVIPQHQAEKTIIRAGRGAHMLQSSVWSSSISFPCRSVPVSCPGHMRSWMLPVCIELPRSSHCVPTCAAAWCACLDLTLLFAMALSALPS